MARRFLIAILLLLPTLLPAADQDWTEVRTPHFVVVTDAGEKKGREVGLRFEQMRSVFGTLLQRSSINIPVSTQIVAFRSRDEIEKSSSLDNRKLAETSGFYLRGQDRDFIAIDVSSSDPYGPVLHELAHTLLDANYPRTQPWFDEGFAEYFSAAQITNKEVTLGAAHEGHDLILRGSPWMPFTELAKVANGSPVFDEIGGHRSLFYAESWMLVHYIFDQHKLPETANYFDLVENKGTSPAEALRQAFGIDAATFLKNVQDHYRAGHALPIRLATAESLQPDLFPARKLSSIEAQSVMADLHAHSPDHRDQARAEYEGILKIDPNQMAAHRGLGFIALQKKDLASAEKHFREGRAINAKDPRLLYLSALLLTMRPDPNNLHRSDPALMETYLVGATNLESGFAEAWNLLAEARRRQDKFDLAIDAEVNAVKLSARNENYQQALGRLYLDARQLDNARYVFTALRSSQNEATARGAEAMLSAIDRAKENGGKVALPTAQEVSHGSEASPDEQVIDHGKDNATASPAGKPDMRPVKFMRATLAGVSCDGKSAVLNLALSTHAKGAKGIRVRMMKMLVPDIQQVILVGVDTFSCDWRNHKVALNYKAGASPNAVAKVTGYEGDVVSIEMQ